MRIKRLAYLYITLLRLVYISEPATALPGINNYPNLYDNK